MLRRGRTWAVADIALRVNPDVDSRTHPYISPGAAQHKFGVAAGDAMRLYRKAHHTRHLRVTGLSCHIGSQITSIEPFLTALSRLKALLHCLREEGIRIRHLDLGRAGIVYGNERPPQPGSHARELSAMAGSRL
jgi:diaminopimelate decarboxylase